MADCKNSRNVLVLAVNSPARSAAPNCACSDWSRKCRHRAITAAPMPSDCTISASLRNCAANTSARALRCAASATGVRVLIWFKMVIATKTSPPVTAR